MNEALNTVITGFVTYFVTNLAKRFDFLQSQEHKKFAIRLFVAVISIVVSVLVVLVTQTNNESITIQTFTTTLLNAIGAYYFANGKYHTKQDPSLPHQQEIEYLETEVKSE